MTPPREPRLRLLGDPDRPILLADSDARDNGENDMGEGDNAGVIVRPPLLYAAALGAMLVLRWLWPLPILGGAGLGPGLALVGLAVGLLIWGRGTLVTGGTNVDPSLPSTAVVTSGPYRFSRNPL